MSRPAAESGTCDPYRQSRTQSIREKIWTGSYIDLALLTKQTRDLRLDPHVSGELVIETVNVLSNNSTFIENLHSANTINNWTTTFNIHVYMCILRKVSRESPGNVKVHAQHQILCQMTGSFCHIPLWRGGWAMVKIELWGMLISPGQYKESQTL